MNIVFFQCFLYIKVHAFYTQNWSVSFFLSCSRWLNVSILARGYYLMTSYTKHSTKCQAIRHVSHVTSHYSFYFKLSPAILHWQSHLRCCHALCGPLSSLTLTLSMSSRPRVPGPALASCCWPTSTLQFPPDHQWPQTQQKRNREKMSSYQELTNYPSYDYDTGFAARNDPSATNSLFLGVFITLIPKVLRRTLMPYS